MKNHLLVYIGGYVVSKLSPNLEVQTCGTVQKCGTACHYKILKDLLDTCVSKLLHLKDRSWLKHPPGSTFKIVVKAKKVLITEIAAKKRLTHFLLEFIKTKNLQ